MNFFTKTIHDLILIGLFLFGFCFATFSQTHEGKDFWLSFMEHVDVNANTKVLMIASKKGANGNVSMPSNPYSVDFTVPPNSVIFVTAPLFSAETKGSEIINQSALHIVSDDTIVVYAHQYNNARSEAALILPKESLGMEYYILSYEGYNSGQVHPSEFLIVATEDNTLVNWTPTENTAGGKFAGSLNSVVLSQGEAFQVQAATASDDLSGSKVTSNRPIAVFAGDEWTEVGGCGLRDNLYEQMYATKSWGKEFVSVLNVGRSHDESKIIAKEDGTKVYINGILQAPVLNAGQYMERNLNQASYIRSNNNIMIGQYMVGGSCAAAINNTGDPMMVLLNPISKSIKKSVFFASPFQNIVLNYLNIAIRTTDVSQVVLDGVNIQDSFNLVPSNALYSYARLRLDTGVHILEATGSCGFVGTVYGQASPESYGYSLGAKFSGIADIVINNQNNSLALKNSGCVADSLVFFAESEDSVLFQYWDFGDGFFDSVANSKHVYADTGEYLVRLTVAVYSPCNGSDTDEVFQYIRIGKIDTVVYYSENVCLGTPLDFYDSSKVANDLIVRWLWDFGDGVSDTMQQPAHLYLDSGTYLANLTIGTQYGCIGISTYEISEVYPLPIFDAGLDKKICETGSTQIGDTNVSYYNYLWQPSSGLNDTVTSNPIVTISQNMKYNVTVTDVVNNCQSEDSIDVLIVSNPISMLKDTTIIVGACFILDAGIDTGTFEWSPSDYLDDINVAHPISCPRKDMVYQLMASQNGCSVIDQIKIIVLDDYNIEVPSAFTPNNDGNNDLLLPVMTGINSIESFLIYNRWGQKVHHGYGSNIGWDGFFENKEQVAGVYVWYLNAIALNGESVALSGQSALIK